jgi:hypothetical protein
VLEIWLMGGSLSSPFLLRKSFSNHFSHANEKLSFTLHIDLGNPACRSADRAKLFRREQTERHQDRGDVPIQRRTDAFHNNITTTPLCEMDVAVIGRIMLYSLENGSLVQRQIVRQKKEVPVGRGWGRCRGMWGEGLPGVMVKESEL